MSRWGIRLSQTHLQPRRGSPLNANTCFNTPLPSFPFPPWFDGFFHAESTSNIPSMLYSFRGSPTLATHSIPICACSRWMPSWASQVNERSSPPHRSLTGASPRPRSIHPPLSLYKWSSPPFFSSKRTFPHFLCPFLGFWEDHFFFRDVMNTVPSTPCPANPYDFSLNSTASFFFLRHRS